MRPAFLALAAALLLAPAPARGNCTPGGLNLRQAWPAHGSVDVARNTHVLVLLHGTDEDKAKPPKLALHGPDGVVVPLQLVHDLPGEGFMRARTLIYRPAYPLAPDTEYQLDTVPRTPGLGPHTIRSGRDLDVAAPVPGDLQVGSFERIEFGCGPAHHLPIGVEARDERSPLWLRLRVARDERALADRTFVGDIVIPVTDARADFGHDMCIGNWPLRPGQRWVAEATVLDAALHATPPVTLVLDAGPPLTRPAP